jgi:phosphatidylserine/phosphatidylglycerophosphate/cardiolipin synthase-like enzyme
MDSLEKTIKFLLLLPLLVSCRLIEKEDSHEQPTSITKTTICAETICKLPPPSDNTCRWQVKFSPNGGAEKQIVDTILDAKESLYVLSYSFTSDNIAKALVHMSNSNVHVEAILDPSNKSGKGSDLSTLLEGGVTTYIDSEHAIAHNKVIIRDERYLLTGSFNFTSAAEKRNAENSLLLDCPELAKTYLNNWKLHKEHSEKVSK